MLSAGIPVLQLAKELWRSIVAILYKLDFASGKSYVGVTSSPLPVHRAWAKYGKPKVAVLAIVQRKDLPDVEQAQVRWAEMINALGGDAAFATGEGTI
jgi:hypothetical protein